MRLTSKRLDEIRQRSMLAESVSINVVEELLAHIFTVEEENGMPINRCEHCNGIKEYPMDRYCVTCKATLAITPEGFNPNYDEFPWEEE